MKSVEAMHQEALFVWANRTINGLKVSDYLFAIPNGGTRNVREAASLKRQGVKAGISDVFLPVPRGAFHGLWIELKAPARQGKAAGRATAEQITWLDRMAAQGYMAVLCTGWTAAADTIHAYLGDNNATE